MKPILRPARPADYATIATWVADASACARWAGPRLAFPFSAAELPALLAVENSCSFSLAPGEAEPLGFAQFWRRDADTVHLGRIIVAPHARGRGYGTLLCTQLIAAAVQATGARRITLRVYRDNLRAYAMYTGLGFQVIESGSDAEVFEMEAFSEHFATDSAPAALTLRPASNHDRAEIEQLVFGVLREYGLAPDLESTDADLHDIEHNYIGQGGSFDVLVDARGRIIGTVGLYAISPEVCELRKMYLAADARGQGLGRRLLQHALDKAKQLNFSQVRLETASVLKEAIALYERYGFRKFAPCHLSSRCDSAYFADI